MNITKAFCALTLMWACLLSPGCGSGEPTVIQPGEPFKPTEVEQQRMDKSKVWNKQSLKDQLTEKAGQ